MLHSRISVISRIFELEPFSKIQFKGDYHNEKAVFCKEESTRAGGSQCPYCSGIKLLKGFNDLVTTHPAIAEEWSELNYPLLPEQVNEKSTKNVWWKCKVCGNEWKAVINACVKGVFCPVCVERMVLKGYNDLATTDAVLCKEWDYKKNKVEPTQISRNSHNRAWWLCKYGHSWNAKICERTHESKTCTVCESEFDSLLVQLLVSLYAKQYNFGFAICKTVQYESSHI